MAQPRECTCSPDKPHTCLEGGCSLDLVMWSAGLALPAVMFLAGRALPAVMAPAGLVPRLVLHLEAAGAFPSVFFCFW